MWSARRSFRQSGKRYVMVAKSSLIQSNAHESSFKSLHKRFCMPAMPFRANGLITLTTDFGLSDPYVGVMKGVILARHPAARLVDLTHQVPAFQAEVAGFWLARVWRYFPTGTAHLAVVDPGVGTERAMLLLSIAGQVFIAPDNGLLEPLLRSAPGVQGRVFGMEDLAHLSLSTPSRTFHGRDIFAPLIAEIAANRQAPELLGQCCERQPQPLRVEMPGEGRVVCVDHYGNLLTDIAADDLGGFKEPVVLIRGQRIAIRPGYGFAARGELLGLINAWGLLEIARSQGNAQRHLQVMPGERVQVLETALGAL